MSGDALGASSRGDRRVAGQGDGTEYAARSSISSVELSAGPIEYQDTGGGGAAVVFVHGLLMNGAQWRHVVANLRDEFRCISPTLPMGAHRRPMRPDADLSLRGLGRILTEFLDRLDLTDVTLCFNDWCGAQVMIADRGVDRVGRLVLCSCEAFDNYPPGVPGRLAAMAAHTPGALSVLRRTLTVGWIRGLPMSFGRMSKHGIPDELMREWMAPLSQRGVRRDFCKYAGDTRRGRRDLVAATPALATFGRPVLVVWAREDRIMPVADGPRLAAAFPDSRFVDIPDSYTLIPLDQPDLLAKHIGAFTRANPKEMPSEN